MRLRSREESVARHSLYLNEFIEEILRTGGAALAGQEAPPTQDDLERDFLAAARRATSALFGDSTEIDVEIGPELGEIHYIQILKVVKTPSDPLRELSLEVVHGWGAEYEDVEEGEELLFRIYYTHDPSHREEIARIESLCGDHLPLPVHSPELWDALTEQLNNELLRYFPGPAFDEGTLGALLEQGGGWTRGLTARSGNLELALESAFLDAYRISTSSCWIDYGFVIVLRREGVEIFRGDAETPWKCLDDGPNAPSVEALVRGDNEDAVLSWASLPTSEAAKPALLQALQTIVDGLAKGTSINGRTGLEELLSKAITPPRSGGFWEWLRGALPRRLVGFTHSFQQEGATLHLTIDEVFEPWPVHRGFGRASVHVALTADSDRVEICPEGTSIDAGAASQRSLDLAGPRDADEERELEQIIVTYTKWLARHVEHHVARNGLEGLSSMHYFYGIAGYFPLVDILERRLLDGPPGPPPVPPFSYAALDDAARRLQPAEEQVLEDLVRADAGKSHIIAAFEVEGWLILLEDDISGLPFGSYCGVSLVPPDSKERVDVMMVDAWNPPTRLVVDGDAFAFGRLLTWLRQAILRGDMDTVLEYKNWDYDWEPDEGDEAPERLELKLSDWLLFELPDEDDRSIVDWRAQWHVVNAGEGIEAFKGIYGFKGSYLERLTRYHIPQWRRFLVEVVDPRFEYSR
jgi:hypothetical protein